MPTPLLEVAADLHNDDDHVEEIRSYYNANFDIASAHLRITPPDGGFLWLKVDDDIDFVKRLMAEHGYVPVRQFYGCETDCGNPAVATFGLYCA